MAKEDQSKNSQGQIECQKEKKREWGTSSKFSSSYGISLFFGFPFSMCNSNTIQIFKCNFSTIQVIHFTSASAASPSNTYELPMCWCIRIKLYEFTSATAATTFSTLGVLKFSIRKDTGSPFSTPTVPSPLVSNPFRTLPPARLGKRKKWGWKKFGEERLDGP